MVVKELLDKKNIKYISKGRDYIVRCLNPEHEDRNPSMRIDKLTGIFNCYSCGYSGDLYALFKVSKGRILNIKLEQVRQKILDLLGSRALPLPLDRVPILEDFRGISKETLNSFEAFTTDAIKGQEGRIVFPIKNIDGKIIAFQGRYMYSDLEPKYKVYPEHTNLPLYPAVITPINNSIILVEGILDMINLHDKGLTNSICTFGTAFGNVKKKIKQKNNLDKLLQYKYQGADTVYIMYDGDKAGRDASSNLMSYISQSFHVDTIDLDEGMDPGNLTKAQVNKLYGKLYG